MTPAEEARIKLAARALGGCVLCHLARVLDTEKRRAMEEMWFDRARDLHELLKALDG